MRTRLLAGAVLAAVAAGPAMAQGYNWTGFEVGAHLGYDWGHGNTHFQPLPSATQFVNLAPYNLTTHVVGPFGGAQGGYNWQLGMFVVGAEADFSAGHIEGRVNNTPIVQFNGTPFPGTGFVETKQSIDAFGTLRARAGVTPVDRLLAYITAGAAVGQVNYAAVTNFRPVGTTIYATNYSRTQFGWTVGTGLDYAVAGNWQLRLEYLFIDFGSTTSTVNANPLLPPFQVRYHFETVANLGRIGLGYKF
jgi:outer membrane immunogenic protein